MRLRTNSIERTSIACSPAGSLEDYSPCGSHCGEEIQIRILFFSSIYYPQVGGGAEISSRILAAGISKTCECMVLTIGEEEGFFELDGVHVRRIYIPWISEALFPKPFTSRFKRILHARTGFLLPRSRQALEDRFLETLDVFKPDLIHCLNNLYPIPFQRIYALARQRGIPIIQTIRDLRLLGRGDVSGQKRPLWGHYTKKASELVNFYHFPTKYLMETYGRELPPSCGKVHIPNTCGEDFNKKSWDIYLEKRKTKDDLQMIFCGQLMEHKGVIDLAKTYPAIRKTLNKKIGLTFIGEGSCRTDIEKELSSYIQSGEVLITGWIEHAKALSMMGNADFVILPSKWPEVFGRCLVEGFFRGALPIGSKMGGIPEVIGDADLVFEVCEQLPELLGKYACPKERIEKMKQMLPHMLEYGLEEHLAKFKSFYETLKNKKY